MALPITLPFIIYFAARNTRNAEHDSGQTDESDTTADWPKNLFARIPLLLLSWAAVTFLWLLACILVIYPVMNIIEPQCGDPCIGYHCDNLPMGDAKHRCTMLFVACLALPITFPFIGYLAYRLAHHFRKHRYSVEEAKKDIAQILLEDWDPKGILESPESWDEYDSYVDEIYRLLESRAAPESVADHLAMLETKLMGRCFRQKQLLSVAEKLRSLNVKMPSAYAASSSR
ncbi:MAG: hypothetical protein HY927_02460 [Elusimicrobia bacterium]|nr:hypothetical protein [Elusimicrobiota bacterium]